MSRLKEFNESPQLGVVTTINVLRGDPIVLVSHDEDDGGWQFLCGKTAEPSDGRIVCLGEIITLHPSVMEVADLPVGWVAFRAASGERWTREPNE